MSGCFDGRNGRLLKTSGDLRDLRDLQFDLLELELLPLYLASF